MIPQAKTPDNATKDMSSPESGKFMVAVSQHQRAAWPTITGVDNATVKDGSPLAKLLDGYAQRPPDPATALKLALSDGGKKVALIPYLRPLVFCLGLVKTGTSSLLEGLSILGWRGCSDIPAMQLSWDRYFDNRIKLPFADLTHKYRAFSQNPTALNHQPLSKHYPDAKFILTERDTNEAIASMLIHVAWNRLHPDQDKPKHMRWLDLDTAADEKLYSDWSSRVTDHFIGAEKGRQLLIMDITKGDGWDALCPFLDVPVPAQTFPHFNHSKGRLADMLSGRFDYKGKED